MRKNDDDKNKNENPSDDKPRQRNEKGQFVKGMKKVGGRKIGSKNKYGNIRDRLKEIILPYLEYDAEAKPNGKAKSFAIDLMAIADPVDRIDAVAKILPFIIPKYTSTTISADANRPFNEEEQLLELDQQYTKKEVSINIKALTIVDNDNTSGDYDPDDDPDFNIDELK